jgi:hypothetical protein
LRSTVLSAEAIASLVVVDIDIPLVEGQDYFYWPAISGEPYPPALSGWTYSEALGIPSYLNDGGAPAGDTATGPFLPRIGPAQNTALGFFAEFWFNMATTANATSLVQFSIDGTGFAFGTLLNVSTSSTTVTLAVGGTTLSPDTATLNTWHKYRFECSSTATYTYYLDGVQIGTQAGSLLATTTLQWRAVLSTAGVRRHSISRLKVGWLA